jgi:hypothetical protein
MSVIQRIAVIVALVCAGLTTITVTTALNSAASGSVAARKAMSDFEVQSYSDTTIYQQQVTALWANKDLLKAVADQTADANKIASGQLQVSIATNWLLAALVTVGATIAMRGSSAKKKNEDQAPTE